VLLYDLTAPTSKAKGKRFPKPNTATAEISASIANRW